MDTNTIVYVSIAFIALLGVFLNLFGTDLYNKVVKVKLQKKLGVELYSEFEQTLIAAIKYAEKLYSGHERDVDGSKRHGYVKDVLKFTVKKMGLEDIVTDKHVDFLIKFYVHALQFVKGNNPNK